MNYLETEKIISFQNSIKNSWNKTKLGIFNTCLEVSKAKKELSKGSFLELKVPFTQQTKNRLVTIGNYKLFYKYKESIPASWATLLVLSRLGNSSFERLVKNGEIHEKTTRNEAERLVNPERYKKRIEKSSYNQELATIYVTDGYCISDALYKLSEAGLLDDDMFKFDTEKAEKVLYRQFNNEHKQAQKEAIKICHTYLKSKFKNIKEKSKGQLDKWKRSHSELFEYFDLYTFASIIKDPENEEIIDRVLSIVGADFCLQDKYKDLVN